MGQQVFFSLVMHVLYKGKKLLSLVDWLFHFCQKLFWMKAETSFLGWPISLCLSSIFSSDLFSLHLLFLEGRPIFPALVILGGGGDLFSLPLFFSWPIFPALVFLGGGGGDLFFFTYFPALVYFGWPIFPALVFLGGVVMFSQTCFFLLDWPIFPPLFFLGGGAGWPILLALVSCVLSL